MNHKSFYTIVAVIMCVAFLLSACGQAATPTPPPVQPTTPPTEAAACLTIGALYGGPMNDAGYNQAMHESVTAIKQNIACAKIIEAENVPDEAGAKTTMENMISQGAKLIIATAYNHQNPAFDLAKAHADVIFEHAGGWMMADNFANFYANVPNTWYLMGVAAGMMTKSNKLGFVAAFPMGWTATFINAYELGAKSVNPNVQTIVTYTFNWGDRAKEADATNSLINQGVDVITMHVDSPSTVISTAESRGIYSIGFQSLAAQQFAPEYWITGTGFTFGGKLTWLASTVIDKSWKPIFLRCSLSEGCMALAPYGPKVPQGVKDRLTQVLADLDAGKIVVFKGPLKDQNGNVKVAAGAVLTDDQMSSVDWFVEGVIGSPK